MKRLLILLLVPTLVLARSKGARHLDITPQTPDEDLPFTFDLDLNVYGQVGNPGTINDIGTTLYLAPTLMYQYHDLTFQIQSLNVPVRGGLAQNYQMDNYFGIIHTANVTNNIKVNSGAMVGAVYNYLHPGTTPSPIMIHDLSFVDINYVMGEDWLLHAGPYHVNHALSTTTDYFGYECGFQYTLLNFWRFQGDYYSGHSNVSGATVTTTMLFTKQFNFRFGIEVPTHNSGNEFSGDLGVVFKF